MKERKPLHLALGAIGIVFLMFFPFVLGRRVPLLGWADLGFHELGHMLAIPFGTTVHFIAGSATQVLVPIGLAVYFWHKQRDRLATGLMLGWAASSFQDVSVYIADAPYQRLPLIGGTHDWSFLLGRWHLIDQAAGIASMVWFVGLLLGLAGLAVLLHPSAAAGLARCRTLRVRRRFANAPVREIRNPPRARQWKPE